MFWAWNGYPSTTTTTTTTTTTEIFVRVFSWTLSINHLMEWYIALPKIWNNPPQMPFGKYDQIHIKLLICSHLSKKSAGITSLFMLCELFNKQYKDLSSLFHIWHNFLFLILDPGSWTSRPNSKFCLVWQNITFHKVGLTKSRRITIRYFRKSF